MSTRCSRSRRLSHLGVPLGSLLAGRIQVEDVMGTLVVAIVEVCREVLVAGLDAVMGRLHQ